MKKIFDHSNIGDGKQRITVPRKAKKGGVNRNINITSKNKFVVVICLVIIIAVFFFLKYVYTENKKEIVEDVENNIALINSGDLSWVTCSTIDVAGELRNAMIGNSFDEEKQGLPELIIANTQVEYSIGKIKGNTCIVTFKSSGYSFDEYISYCRTNEFLTNEEMIDNFQIYMENSDATYHGEVSMNYQKVDGRWICDYDNPLFLDCMSCGMISTYKDYYNNAVDDVETFINQMNSEDLDDDEE